MNAYTFHIHTSATQAPHKEVVTWASREEFADRLQALLADWPSFERIEAFDQSDKLVLQLAKAGNGDARD